MILSVILTVPLAAPAQGPQAIVGDRHPDAKDSCEYRYVVMAVDTAGNQSSFSNEVTVEGVASPTGD